VISVIGKDRTGIVYETSRILAGANLNITDLNSKILGKGKRALFVMVLEVDIPRQFNLKRLDSAWQKLRKRLKVDVRVKPLEHLAF
jgi:ACT domain-containing protein